MRASSPESLAALRLLLTERFPQAAPRPAAVLPTGVAAIDDAAGGGLPVGGITEVVALAPSSGGQLLISSLLAATRARRMRAALVDARDAFDPQSHEPLLLQHLVWVRCRTLDEAMHAADILVRDANLSLVMLDLRGIESRSVRGVPATTWYRLQRALERTDMAMVVLTAARVARLQRDVGAQACCARLGRDKIAPLQGNDPQASGNPAPFGNTADAAGRPPRSRLHLEGAASAVAEASVARPSAPLGFVVSARLRLNLASAFALPAFDEEQTRLASALPAEVQRSRVGEERRIA